MKNIIISILCSKINGKQINKMEKYKTSRKETYKVIT